MRIHTLLTIPNLSRFSLFFNSQKNNWAMPRKIHTERFPFYVSNDTKRAPVIHYKLSALAEDKDPCKLENDVHRIIRSHPNSVIFLTDKSGLLVRSDEDTNRTRPVTESELKDQNKLVALLLGGRLTPYPGHSCMAIINEKGDILPESQVSLRPAKRIIQGRAKLHREIYTESFSSGVNEAKHTTIAHEISFFARKMINNSRINDPKFIDLTVVPLVHSKKNLLELYENIKTARATNIYNLCTLLADVEHIDSLPESETKTSIIKLIEIAKEFPQLADLSSEKAKVVLAAMACTHALTIAIYGEAHAIDKLTKPDQATQSVVAYCVRALIDCQEYIAFAKKIEFYDNISHLTK